MYSIEWDESKNEENKRKHKISFQAAQYVFSDPNRIERLDQSETNPGEERWQTLGMVGKVLFAVYTDRGDNIRLISARLANMAERKGYYGNYQIDGKGWTKAT